MTHVIPIRRTNRRTLEIHQATRPRRWRKRRTPTCSASAKTAEFDNYRKRIERSRREQADEAVVGLLGEILNVVDDFDIALTVDAGEGGAAYRKGVELIHAKLKDLMAKYGVKPIEALGADFDPKLHQAVIHEESPDHREGEVIDELRKGYMIGDRLLRPSMVKVAKA